MVSQQGRAGASLFVVDQNWSAIRSSESEVGSQTGPVSEPFSVLFTFYAVVQDDDKGSPFLNSIYGWAGAALFGNSQIAKPERIGRILRNFWLTEGGERLHMSI
jgi:hypothetical protein